MAFTGRHGVNINKPVSVFTAWKRAHTLLQASKKKTELNIVQFRGISVKSYTNLRSKSSFTGLMFTPRLTRKVGNHNSAEGLLRYLYVVFGT